MQYVAGLMFSTDRSKVAMVIKAKPAWQSGLFNAIGGKIEEGEDPEVAMAREFQEETGVITHSSEWEYLTCLDGSWGQVYFYRMFDDRVLKVKTMEEEVIQLVNPLELPKNIIGNIRWLVPLALDRATLAPRIIKHMG
jgi:8-oxo-dGTP diphosphatase